MKDESYKFIDESGDKKYFSQIPHYILNHSTAVDQALYLQMKRYAGETGKCYATQETLRKKLGIGNPALKKSLDYLLLREWIKLIGTTKGKTRPIKTYAITDIWKLNIIHYEKIVAKRTVSFKGDSCQNDSKIVAETTVEEEPYKEENSETKVSHFLEEKKTYLPMEDQQLVPREKADPDIATLVSKMEKVRRVPFLSRPKQLKLAKRMKNAGIPLKSIGRRWEELRKDHYYQENEIEPDLASVLSSFDKRPPTKEEKL